MTKMANTWSQDAQNEPKTLSQRDLQIWKIKKYTLCMQAQILSVCSLFKGLTENEPANFIAVQEGSKCMFVCWNFGKRSSKFHACAVCTELKRRKCLLV